MGKQAPQNFTLASSSPPFASAVTASTFLLADPHPLLFSQCHLPQTNWPKGPSYFTLSIKVWYISHSKLLCSQLIGLQKGYNFMEELVCHKGKRK